MATYYSYKGKPDAVYDLASRRSFDIAHDGGEAPSGEFMVATHVLVQPWLSTSWYNKYYDLHAEITTQGGTYEGVAEGIRLDRSTVTSVNLIIDVPQSLDVTKVTRLTLWAFEHGTETPANTLFTNSGKWSYVYAYYDYPSPELPIPRASGVTHNPRPFLPVSYPIYLAINEQTHMTAEGWTGSNTGGNGYTGDGIVFRPDAPLPEGETVVQLYNADDHGHVENGVATVTYEPLTFDDPILYPGTTVIRAVHLNQLRAALEDYAAYYGLTAPAWAEPIEAGTTSLAGWYNHIAEIWAFVQSVRDYVNAFDAFSAVNKIRLPAFTPHLQPLAADVMQLRQIVTTL